MVEAFLEATLVGSGASPGQLLYARSSAAGPSRLRQHPPASTSNGLRDRRDRTIRRTAYLDDNGNEEEISWWGRTVVWCKGMEVHRQFTFEDGGDAEEKVMWAGFVWFPPHGSASFPSSRLHHGEGQDAKSGLTELRNTLRPGREGLFGPFHGSQHLVWGQPVPPTSDRNPPRLVRTLVICRTEQATAYFPSGDDFKFHLPFAVDAAFPLPPSIGGIVLQRALTRSERRDLDRGRAHGAYSDPRHQSLVEALENSQGPSDPRVYALMNPFQEARKVIEASVIDDRIVEEGGPLECTDDILFSADDPYPFVLAYDRRENELVFYSRHLVPIADRAAPPLARFMRPEDLLPTPPTNMNGELPRPSLQRTGSAFTAGERRISNMQGEASDRTRGGPRISRGGKIDATQIARDVGSRPSNSTAELQAALDPFSLPPSVPSQVMNSRLSSKGISRVSALGGEGSLILEENPRQGLFGAPELDLRETTMMMGLDRGSLAERSEVVLERLHTWKAPR